MNTETAVQHYLDKNGDEFIFNHGVWSWIDIEGNPRGEFASKEEARADAYDHFWG